MNGPAHLNDEQLARYHDRALTAVELLELDSHVLECAACRERLYVRQGAAAKIGALRAELSGHLDYAGVVACSEGNGTPAQTEHVAECAMCQGEVLDLSRFRTELRDSPRVPLQMPGKGRKSWAVPAGIAAALLLTAGGAMVAIRRQAPGPAVSAVRPSSESPVPAAERHALELAVASHGLERAPVLDQLITNPGTLRGGPAPAGKRFELLLPVGTTVVSDNPVFRWTPLDGATGYVVSVFDERFEKVAESPTVVVPEWQAAPALPRGRVLSWQVSAKVRGNSVHAPAPPAAEARFEVVDQQTADQIAAMRREHPGNSLLLAMVLARAGALDEALGVLRGIDSPVAQQWTASIERMRRP